MHSCPSSHSGAPAPTHPPSTHASVVVQASPSSQGPSLLARFWQPSRASHTSLVHASASSHTVWSSSYVQPVAATHASTVHASPSSQSGAPAVHAPSAQVSPTVQASESSQPAVVGVYAQPVPIRHASAVQGEPSSQTESSGVTTQPVALSHASTVHGTPSSHTRAWPLHSAHSNESPTVHASPSSHGAPGAEPMHCPAWQPSTGVQGLPSSHGAPSAANPSAGHSAVPAHVSAGSQIPLETLHTTSAASSVQLAVQHTPCPGSHSSAPATTSSPQVVEHTWGPFPTHSNPSSTAQASSHPSPASTSPSSHASSNATSSVASPHAAT